MRAARVQVTKKSPRENLARRAPVPRVRRPQQDQRYSSGHPDPVRHPDCLLRALSDDLLPFRRAPALFQVLSSLRGSHLEKLYTREPHWAPIIRIFCGLRLLHLMLVHHLHHYRPNRDRRQAIRYTWTPLNIVFLLHRRAVDPRSAGRRHDLRSGLRRFRNTGYIGKRHPPHHWGQPLRPLFIRPRLPERL